MTILPNDIPDDAAPLSGVDYMLASTKNLHQNSNVFVTLFTGKTLVGLCRWVDGYHVTIGTSDPIHCNLIETAREV